MKTNKALFITISILSLLLILGQGFVQGSEKKDKGYLGICIANLNKAESSISGITYGVKITRVIEDSPAGKGGLKEYDIIQAFNHKKIEDTEDLYNLVRETEPQTKVTISLLRGGKTKSIEVILEQRKSYKNIFNSSHPIHKFYSIYMGPYLGIQLQELNTELGSYFGVKEREGVLVLSVRENSPAEKAGIKAGDVIIQIEEEIIEDPEDVLDIISDYEESDTLNISLIRHQKKMTLQVLIENNNDHNIDIFKWHGSIPEKHFRIFGNENRSRSYDFNLEKNFAPEIRKHLRRNILRQKDIEILFENRGKNRMGKFQMKIISI